MWVSRSLKINHRTDKSWQVNVDWYLDSTYAELLKSSYHVNGMHLKNEKCPDEISIWREYNEVKSPKTLRTFFRKRFPDFIRSKSKTEKHYFLFNDWLKYQNLWRESFHYPWIHKSQNMQNCITFLCNKMQDDQNRTEKRHMTFIWSIGRWLSSLMTLFSSVNWWRSFD